MNRFVQIDKIARVFSGSTAPQEKKYFVSGIHNFVRAGDLSLFKVTQSLGDVPSKLNDLAINELNLVRAKKRTILFPKSGASILTNNRAMLLHDAYIVNHLAAIEVDEEKYLPELLFFYLWGFDMGTLVDDPSYPSLKLEKIKTIKIPYFEKDEQKRLCDLISFQLAHVESMRQAVLRQMEATKALQSAILREVFPWQTGELLPSGWRWEKVGKYAKFKNGLNYSSSDIQAGVKIVGVSCFQDNFFLDRVNDVEIRKERVREEDYLKKNDILIVRSNGSADLVGRHLLYVGEEKVTHSGFTIRLRLDENEIHPLFYMYFARSDFFKNQTRGQGANIKNVSQAKLSKVDIPLPKTVEDQLVIVEMIQKKMTSAQKTMTAIENQLAAIDALPAAVLREAFHFEKTEN